MLVPPEFWQKVREKQPKDATCCFKQILEVKLYKIEVLQAHPVSQTIQVSMNS